jgi:hypothetical protein
MYGFMPGNGDGIGYLRSKSVKNLGNLRVTPTRDYTCSWINVRIVLVQ